MKKLLLALTVLLLVVGCGSKQTDDNTIRVAATLDPHAKILEYVKPALKEQGYDLEITVLDDYYIFNESLNSNEVDANYFQHIPFFNNEIEKNGYEIVNAGGVHIEPFGIYSKTISNVEDIPNEAEIIISNSISDYGRILAMLQDAGLIKLKEGTNIIDATLDDIAENYKNLQFIEIKPELLTIAFENNEGDLVAINGNYAIADGLNPLNDSLILESATSDNPYVNIVAVQKGHENDPKIVALLAALKSDDTKQFITDTYQGAVIPCE